jgi:hypothetical protein
MMRVRFDAVVTRKPEASAATSSTVGQALFRPRMIELKANFSGLTLSEEKSLELSDTCVSCARS